MKARGHTPERTCISCGTKRRKNDLIKLMKDNENRLIRDDSGRLQGRGAYVCGTPVCLRRLLNNKHLKKYFRTDGDICVGHELYEIIRLSEKTGKSGKQQ